jgi:predicted Zn-dependent protease
VGPVLAPPLLNAYIDQVAARADAAFPGMSELLDRARSEGVAKLNVPDALATQTPVAAFVRGLALLAQNQYTTPAGAAFRSAMRASPDFYPAMVYLGACYAAAGNDKEAAAIWRTALIKEGDVPAVHLLLADALLRQGNGATALQVIESARARWPEDEDLQQRFVTASILAGDTAAGFQTLDGLLRRNAADEPSLALAILTLYDAISHGRTIQGPAEDRARMLQLAEAYRAHGGPSQGLVDMWVAAVKDGGPPKPR